MCGLTRCQSLDVTLSLSLLLPLHLPPLPPSCGGFRLQPAPPSIPLARAIGCLPADFCTAAEFGAKNLGTSNDSWRRRAAKRLRRRQRWNVGGGGDDGNITTTMATSPWRWRWR
ncbi:unnamed protein product [Phaeothamnion confervicola]